MKTRTGFVFYENYYKLLKALPTEEGMDFLKKICAYALYGEVPESFSSELSEAIWSVLFPSLQKGRVNAENRMEKEPKPEETPAETKRKADETVKRDEKTKAFTEMGIEVDCDPEGVEQEKLKEAFEKSEFLRKTFKTLSKVKRFYRKILSGEYDTVKSSPNRATGVDDGYMKHGYSAEKLRSALVDFSKFEDEG